MRYVTKLKILARNDQEGAILDLLSAYGVPRSSGKTTQLSGAKILEISFEKDDPLQEQVKEALERKLGGPILAVFEPLFEPTEVESAELLHLFIRGLCGPAFTELADELQLAPGTPVMDKREMKKQEIALTYGFDVVISERLRQILIDQRLTGWQAQRVLHMNPERDTFPPFYHFTSTNTLPPLAPETDLERIKRSTRKHQKGARERSIQEMPEMTSIFQRGPLVYLESNLNEIMDFNHTSEAFGEPPHAQPLIVITQKAWRVFLSFRIRNVDVEPVITRGRQ